MSDVEGFGSDALIPTVGGLIGSVVTTIASAREAEKNRKFQERMSSTAHQREVADMIKAGLNPALSGMRGGGASTPSGAIGQVADYGQATARGLAHGLAVRQANAQIRLLEEQARKAGTEADVASALVPSTLSLANAQAAIAEQNLDQMKAMFPLALDKARAEILRDTSSARAAAAAARLDELASRGAINEAEFQELVGKYGPWGRVVAGMVKLGVGAAAGVAVVKSAGKANKFIPRRKR